MIIVLKTNPSDEDVAFVEDKVRASGYEPHTIRGVKRTVVAAVGDELAQADLTHLASFAMVDTVMPVQKRYKLVSREVNPEPATVPVGGLTIGGGTFHIIAGPCSVEGPDQLRDTAVAVKAGGATLLRGGAFKPRTSPYDFQGMGGDALKLLEDARAETGMPIVTEVVSESDLAVVAQTADVLQIGARNAMNYSLLTAVAGSGKPVLLKRGIAATIDEWLLAAEYLLKHGNRNVILCERGIRTFETATRNTLDLGAVAVAKVESNLPVIVDPSHAAGRRDILVPLSKAAIAAGADGLMVEVHVNPEAALSDAAQQLLPEDFAELVREVRPFVELVGKRMGG